MKRTNKRENKKLQGQQQRIFSVRNSVVKAEKVKIKKKESVMRRAVSKNGKLREKYSLSKEQKESGFFFLSLVICC